MNRKLISIILLIIFITTLAITLSNALLKDTTVPENQTGTLTVDNKTVHYEKMGKCVEVIDANTIQVYGVGRVQLTQIGQPTAEANKYVTDKCLGKTVYLDIDDEKPEDDYGRTLAIVYTDSADINHELIKNNLVKTSYFEPSEFKKGEV